MKNLFISIIFSFAPFLCYAQSEWERPMTPEERLEQAKKEEKEAKKAEKEARKAAKKALKEAKEKEKEALEAGRDAEQAVAAGQVAEYEKRLNNLSSTGKKNTINAKDAKYIEKGAVPEVDGKIVFTLDEDIPGKTAQQIYDIAYAFLDSLSREKNQIRSSIALINKKEHIIAARYKEWLEFSRNFMSLDRTELNYTIIARCSDGHLAMTMERISYDYEKNRSTGFSETAENWISDKNALNKKRTKLLPISAKFRRGTIDRKDQIFNEAAAAFKKQ